MMSVESRMDVRSIAMQYFLGLTGTKEGKAFLSENAKRLGAIVQLIKDPQEAIAKDAFLALVNLSTEEDIARKLLDLFDYPDFDKQLLECILQKDSAHADIACSVLSNLSRPKDCAQKILNTMHKHPDKIGMERLVFAFCQNNYNERNNKLHYIGPILSNLTQLVEARKHVMDKEKLVIQRLLPFLEFKDSITRRGGIVGAIHNCCFEQEYHDWLLGEEVDLLPRLLLPLAGPEEFDEDDMEKLPEDLQYLEPDKKREADPDIRKMLVETVFQLCATPSCRKYIKEKNTYVIMRELFNWEKDPVARQATEKLIHLLIGDEPEAGMENLGNVEIPPDVETKLKDIDLKENEELEKEIASAGSQ